MKAFVVIFIFAMAQAALCKVPAQQRTSRLTAYLHEKFEEEMADHESALRQKLKSDPKYGKMYALLLDCEKYLSDPVINNILEALQDKNISDHPDMPRRILERMSQPSLNLKSNVKSLRDQVKGILEELYLEVGGHLHKTKGDFLDDPHNSLSEWEMQPRSI